MIRGEGSRIVTPTGQADRPGKPGRQIGRQPVTGTLQGFQVGVAPGLLAGPAEPHGVGSPGGDVIQVSAEFRQIGGDPGRPTVQGICILPQETEGVPDFPGYGIVPPQCGADQAMAFVPRLRCPRCSGAQTEQLSRFGSTPCKSTWRCIECGEPFEYFKAL